MKRNARFANLLILLTFVLVIGGCNTTSSPSKSGNESAPATESATEIHSTPSDAKIETVELTLWTRAVETEKYRYINIQDAAEKLNQDLLEEGANIQIKLDVKNETIKWGDYKQNFVLASESNKAPDIILSNHEDSAPWASAGYIIQLDSYISKNPQFDHIIDNIWNSVTYKGNKWGIPQDIEARVIYYRKDHLEKLGWSKEQIDGLPAKIKNGEFVLDDLLKLAKEVQDKGLVKEGEGFFHRPLIGTDFYMFYQAFGGKLQDLSSGKLILNKQALLKEYEFFHDTVFKYKTTKKNFIGMEWSMWHEQVASGVPFSMQGGSWHVAEWKEKYNLTDDLFNNLGFALVPAGEKGNKPVTLSHPMAYMVSSASKNPDLAMRLIAYATTPEMHIRHVQSANSLAILKGEDQLPAYKQNQLVQDLSYMVEFSQFIPNNDQFGIYDQAIFRGLTAVEGGQMSPQDAVDTVVSELQLQLGGEVIIE